MAVRFRGGPRLSSGLLYNVDYEFTDRNLEFLNQPT